MIEFFKNLFKKKEPIFFPGILGEQSSANVYELGEVVGQITPPVWVDKEWRQFLPQFQFTSSSCVAFTVAKLAQILYYLKFNRLIKFSPGWIYKQRTPKQPGMWIDNAVSIAGGGLPTEELYPSEGLNEMQINNLPTLPYTDGIAKEFAISINWINLPLDFDTVASSIQATQKGIMLWFQFGVGEFFRQGIPQVLYSDLLYKHSVCAVDAVLYKGVQYLVIEDSAEVNGTFEHRKLVSRDFFNRCYLARYPLAFKFDSGTTKPHYAGNTTSLQDCLKYGGFMPSNVPSTGVYGIITTESVKKFQVANNIQQTGTVGPVTSARLSVLFP